MAESAFKLKDMRDIFRATDPLSNPKGDPIYNIMLEKLHPYKSHPFKLYTGQRFDDMVESVKANGVIVPIIIRLIDDFNYEILSGHNRVEAARAAGLETVPCIIRDGLTDDEALLIVTETNLLQRSFADLTHSERAVTLAMHHDAIKQQGKRTDLIAEIENMLKASPGAENSTSAPMVRKLETREKVAQDYGLDRGTMTRYLRVNMLIQSFKDRLDAGDIALRAAVSISYLPEDEQRIVDDVLDSSHYKLDMKKAESLRMVSAKKPLTHEDAEQVLAGKKKPKTTRRAHFTLKPKILSRYFGSSVKDDEIEATIIEALDLYYANKNPRGDESVNEDGNAD